MVPALIRPTAWKDKLGYDDDFLFDLHKYTEFTLNIYDIKITVYSG